MLGIFLHDLWLVNATIFAVLAAFASVAVMAGLSLGLAPFLDRLFGRPVAQSRPSARGENMSIGRDDGGARRVTRWNSSSARMRRAVPFVILAGLGLWVLARPARI